MKHAGWEGSMWEVGEWEVHEEGVGRKVSFTLN